MAIITLTTSLLVILATLQLTTAAKMPDYIKICSRSDPDLAGCVRNSIDNLKAYLKDGIKEINVPAMEPLYIGDLNILEGGPGGIHVKAKKLNIYGASNFDIKKMKASDGGKRFDFELNLPRLEGEGFYDIDGNILALSLKGSGPFKGNFTNFYSYVNVQFDSRTVNDVEYIAIRYIKVKIRTGKGTIRLENLFNGDKTLGDVINDTINQNFEVFTNELIGPIERALEKKFTSIATKMLENFTFDELLPA